MTEASEPLSDERLARELVEIAKNVRPRSPELVQAALRTWLETSFTLQGQPVTGRVLRRLLAGVDPDVALRKAQGRGT